MNEKPVNYFDAFVRRSLAAVLSLGLIALLAGTFVNDQFWRTDEQRGDRLMSEKAFAAAADLYSDPMKQGAALYRDGQFEAAAQTYVRVNSADGLFNQGNAWLMNGKYDRAISTYDRALKQRPNWSAAKENREIALARKALLDTAAEQRTDQGTEIGADKVVFDEKGDNEKGKDTELSEGGELSDVEMRAMWLRQVKTTPGDFLRAKFAYQAAVQQRKVDE